MATEVNDPQELTSHRCKAIIADPINHITFHVWQSAHFAV